MLDHPGDVARLAQVLAGPWPGGAGLRQAVLDLPLEGSLDRITSHLEQLTVS